MANHPISLPSPVWKFVKEEVKRGGFRDEQDYVCRLVFEAPHAKSKHDLEAKLLVGLKELDAGKGIEVTPGYWKYLKARLRRRLRRVRGGRP